MKYNAPSKTGPFAGNEPLAELILESMDELICIVNSNRAFTFINRAMRRFFGMQEEIQTVGLSEYDIERLADFKFAKGLDEAFAKGRIIKEGVPESSDPSAAVLFSWTPVLAKNGSVTTVIGVGRRTDEHKISTTDNQAGEHQGFVLRLSDSLRSLMDSGDIQREATRLLGEHLNVDRTYYAACDESLQLAIIEQDYVRNNLSSLVGIHHYADFQAIVETIRTGKAFIAEDVTTMPEINSQLDRYLGNQMRALVAIPLMKKDQMVACLAITSSAPRYWLPHEIALLEEVAERTWEAVERGRFETALRENEELMSAIFESLPVGVGLIENDGTVSLGNSELHRYLRENKMPSADKTVAARWKARDSQGQQVEQHNYPGVRAARVESVLPGIETLYTNRDGRAIWTQVAAVPFVNSKGKSGGLITVVSDIDQIKRTTKALQEVEQQFSAFVSASSDLVYRMSADWKQMYTLSGSGFLRQTDKPNSDWLKSYIPRNDQALVLQTIAKAIAKKSMFELEHRINLSNGEIGWVFSRAIPLLDESGKIREWLGAVSDVNMRKMAEQQLQDFASRLEQQVNERTSELKNDRDKLQSILDTSLMQMSILQAVRNEQGEVIDIEIMLVNKKHEQVMGRSDLVGLHYVKEYPGMKESVLFGLIVKTIETGEPQETEYYYPYEGFNSWYTSMFVKLNDGVVAFTMDISKRKSA